MIEDVKNIVHFQINASYCLPHFVVPQCGTHGLEKDIEALITVIVTLAC